MNEILKAAQVEGQALSPEELALINCQSVKTLTAEEVFTFRVAACNDQVDRDGERFTPETLEELSRMFVGKTMLMDHDRSAARQTARIYAGGVEDRDGGGTAPSARVLVLRAYMLRGGPGADTISAIEGGILREVSVGCRVKRALCSVCGTDKAVRSCAHTRGGTYNGAVCHVALDGAADAYEVSFTPVPAQPAAGVIKRYGGEDVPESPAPTRPESINLRLRMLACTIHISEQEE